MKLSLLKACCRGGGGSCVVSKSFSSKSSIIRSKAGNNVAITGSIVLLLVWSFVGNCGGKPFHSVGQAEVEEDTTQGSLKEKFPRAGLGSRDSLFTDDDDDDENDDEPIMVGNLGLAPLGGGNYGMEKDNYRVHQSHLKHNPGSNSGMLHKRSLIPGRIPYSGIFDDDSGSDVDDYHQQQKRLNRPITNFSPSEHTGSLPPSASSISSGENSNIRMRQKLLNLRNQYGEKWYTMMGPYAYRKRQILYRQCFFNPISCF